MPLISDIIDPGLAEGSIRTMQHFAEDAPFFAGHFPGHPIVPGVLLLDGVVEAASRLIAETPGGSKPRLRAVEKIRFSRSVHPGETVEYRVTVKPADDDAFPGASRAFHVKGSAFVGSDRCSTCSLILSTGE
jgi:3-hydroxymyristoyl/3-hydroxydecanoyl-(acyl carrier protein) dehydratase